MIESDKSKITSSFRITLTLLQRLKLIFGASLECRYELYLKCPESSLPAIHGFNVFAAPTFAPTPPGWVRRSADWVK